jgi:hypothetical protein
LNQNARLLYEKQNVDSIFAKRFSSSGKRRMMKTRYSQGGQFMSTGVLKFFHVPNIEQLGAKCAIALVSGNAADNSGHLETVTLVARQDGSSHSHIAYTQLSPPFKPAAEQAIRKAQSKALPLLATDGSLSNKLLDLDQEWEETTEAAIREEIALVSDEIGGLLPRIKSDTLRQMLSGVKHS